MSLKPVSFRRPMEVQPRLSKPYVPCKRDARYWTEAELAALVALGFDGATGPAVREVSGI